MIPRRQVKNPHAEAEQFRRRAALGFGMPVIYNNRSTVLTQ